MFNIDGLLLHFFHTCAMLLTLSWTAYATKRSFTVKPSRYWSWSVVEELTQYRGVGGYKSFRAEIKSTSF